MVAVVAHQPVRTVRFYEPQKIQGLACSSHSTGSSSDFSPSSSRGSSTSPKASALAWNRLAFGDVLGRPLVESPMLASPPGLVLPTQRSETDGEEFSDGEEAIDLTEEFSDDSAQASPPSKAQSKLAPAEIRRRLAEIESAMGDKAHLLHPSAVNQGMLESMRTAHVRLLEQLSGYAV